ncbi:MAG: sporulation protein YtxC [Clostridia bacterium]|nr:sporulation protein YtxC [Clostridia bacterium]
MRTITIAYDGYDIDISSILQRRLAAVGAEYVVRADSGGPELTFEVDENGGDKWITALSQLVLRDIAYCEIASLISLLPLTSEEKRSLLPDAINGVRSYSLDAMVTNQLHDFFSENDRFNIDGFLRFRLQDLPACWALAVDAAFRRHVLKDEYMDFVGFFNCGMLPYIPHTGELRVIIHADRSCTITDDKDTRIDCEACGDDGIMNLIVCLAPEHVVVYDLTGECDSALSEMLKRIFRGRISYYC